MQFIKSIWGQHHIKMLIVTDQAIVSCSNFATGILISKILGLGDLGIYSFVWMILMITSSLQQAFINQPMVNEFITLPKEDTHNYVSKLFSIQTYTACMLSVLAIALTILLQKITFFDTLLPLIEILPFLIISYVMNDFMRRIYILLNNMPKVIILDFIINWSQVTFLILNIHNKNLSIDTILKVFTLSYTLGVLVSGLDFFKFKFVFSDFSHILKNHWKIAKWLLLTAIAQWFAGNFFIISSGDLIGTEAAGIVRVAQSIVGVLNVFFIALEYYVPSKAGLIYNSHGKSALLKYIFKVIWIGLLICSLFTGMVFLFSEQLLSVIYGNSYAKYGLIITAFSGFYIIVFTGFPLRFALRAMQDTKAMFVAYIFATVFSILFAKQMIMAWGIWGVIAGLAFTQIVMQLWYIKALFKKQQINIVQ